MPSVDSFTVTLKLLLVQAKFEVLAGSPETNTVSPVVQEPVINSEFVLVVAGIMAGVAIVGVEGTEVSRVH